MTTFQVKAGDTATITFDIDIKLEVDTPKGKTEMPFAHTEAVDTLQTVIEGFINSALHDDADALQEVQDYLGTLY